MPEPICGAALDQLFGNARTHNSYLDRAVPTALLHQIWDLMKMGPTSMNQLPARLVWCTSQSAKDRLAGHCMGANADKVRAAPVTAIIAMDTDFHEYLPEFFPAANGKALYDGKPELRRESAFRNSSLQGAYFIIAVRALGLDCGPMSGFSNDGVDADFLAQTPSWKSNFIATLGYGDAQTLYPRGPRPGFERFNTIA